MSTETPSEIPTLKYGATPEKPLPVNLTELTNLAVDNMRRLVELKRELNAPGSTKRYPYYTEKFANKIRPALEELNKTRHPQAIVGTEHMTIGSLRALVYQGMRWLRNNENAKYADIVDNVGTTAVKGKVIIYWKEKPDVKAIQTHTVWKDALLKFIADGEPSTIFSENTTLMSGERVWLYSHLHKLAPKVQYQIFPHHFMVWIEPDDNATIMK